MILCAHRGSAPPPMPRFFQAIHACKTKAASCHHHVCSKGKVVRIILFAAGWAAPPTALLARKEKLASKSLMSSPLQQRKVVRIMLFANGNPPRDCPHCSQSRGSEGPKATTVMRIAIPTPTILVLNG